MVASKENARRAILAFDRLVNEESKSRDSDRNVVSEFLAAAQRKLPSAEAYQREKTRRSA